MIPKPKTGAGALAELVVIVALALGLALGIQAFLIKPYQIPSESMEPTLDVGQRVLVNRFEYHFRSPKINDVVVFHPPAGAERGNECGAQIHGRQPVEVGTPCPQPTSTRAGVNFIKRIVAGPATSFPSRVAIRSSTASARMRNSPFLAEEATATCPTRSPFRPATTS